MPFATTFHRHSSEEIAWKYKWRDYNLSAITQCLCIVAAAAILTQIYDCFFRKWHNPIIFISGKNYRNNLQIAIENSALLCVLLTG